MGAPSEGVDGETPILRAMFDSASEFSTGVTIVLDAEDNSRWVKENLGWEARISIEEGMRRVYEAALRKM